MPYRLGIIGTGRVAQEHARAAKAVGADLVAVCDCQLDKANAFAQRYSCALAVGSIDEFLAVDGLDAVVVAVPNFLHREISTACLRAGKDVLLEKPMAISVEECDDILETMKATGRSVQVGFVCRFAPKVAAVRQLIEEGKLGSIYRVAATLQRQRGIPGLGRWFTNKALSGGGVLIDIGVHLIDLAMHLSGAKRGITVTAVCEGKFGSPLREYVYEEMWAGPPDLDGVFDVEDAATGLIRFDNGVVLDLNVAWAQNLPSDLMPEGVMVLGDRAGCFFDLWSDRFILTSQEEGAVVDTHIDFDNSDAWTRAWDGQHAAFASMVARRYAAAVDAESGRSVQAIVEAMYASSEQRREVCLAGPRTLESAGPGVAAAQGS